MPRAALFIGFGRAARAREPQAVDVLRRLLDLCAERRSEGAITAFAPVLLAAHGGDLNGFVLVHGSEDQLDALRRDEAFLRVIARAGLVVENLGVVEARVGEGFEAALTRYEEEVREQLAS